MSNKNFTMTFEPRDVPWLLHAFRIQSTTALMCGSKATRDRVSTFTEQLKEMFPVLTNNKIEEYPFYSALTAMLDAKRWTIIQQMRWGKIDEYKPTLLKVDDRTFEITRWAISRELFEAIKQAVDQVAPITCQYYDCTTEEA